MINLISPEQKRDIKAARVNVMLLHYCVMLTLTGLLIALIYGVGFWLVLAEKDAVAMKRESQSEGIKAYTIAEKEADTFRKNLRVAKGILDKETSYSTFLTTLARDLPTGAVLTSLSVGVDPKAKTKDMILDARVVNYDKALELKNKLELSKLFENVSLINTTRPDNIAALTGLEARYPYQASYNVTLSQGATTDTGGVQ